MAMAHFADGRGLGLRRLRRDPAPSRTLVTGRSRTAFETRGLAWVFAPAALAAAANSTYNMRSSGGTAGHGIRHALPVL